MMKSLQLFVVCKKATVIYINRGIMTDSVLLTRARNVKVPRRIPYEPGIRRRQDVFLKDSDGTEDVEDMADIDGEVNTMNLEEAYDINMREKYKSKIRLQQIITAKKFFSPRPQPLMLTCNERQSIRYLHKEDPVQWDIRTLSESFPATPDTIKKILKGKWKITPERAKLLDSKAQKNWDLLAEGKLDADPNVLEHLKKFINRREVLLEQIKNEKFYLPEVKKEPVWNNGEFTNVLVKYEKAVKRLVATTEKANMLESGTSELIKEVCNVKNEGDEKKSILDVVHEKVNEEVSRNKLENKDSFLYGGLTKFYSKEVTLEQLEEKVLKQADEKKPLNILEKAILENKLGVKNESNFKNLRQNVSFTPEKSRDRYDATDMRGEFIRERNMKSDSSEIDGNYSNSKNLRKNVSFTPEKSRGRYDATDRRERNMNSDSLEIDEDNDWNSNPCSVPDSRTHFTDETGVGKLLSKLKKTDEPKEPKTETRNTDDKPKIDFSDPERIRRENTYYNAEVEDIKNTAFWNNGRTSKEKALAELEKRPPLGPNDDDSSVTRMKTSILSSEPYPKRIFIPKNKRGSGLTFKVKDCYYDDDGEFLYRVPGMVN